MAGGTWSTTAPPQRAGIYFNFIAAVSAAVAAGPQGIVGTIGTANWGPIGQPTIVTSQGGYEALFGTTSTQLRDAVLSSFSGFDLGGATQVIAYRIAGSLAAAGTLTLKNATKAALKLAAKYKGTRANKWSISIVTEGANKGLFLYEEGKLLTSYTGIEKGYAENFAKAIEARIAEGAEPYLGKPTVEAGEGALALANIVGVVGGEGGFTAGNDGTTLLLAEFTEAYEKFSQLTFTCLCVPNIADWATGDSPTLDGLAAMIKEYNLHSGLRAFGIVGGKEGETLAEAAQRSYNPSKPTEGNYNNPDIINLGVTDLVSLATGATIPTAKLCGRLAGAVANAGLRRALAGITLTGYQVVKPPSNAQYIEAIEKGVMLLENISSEVVEIAKGTTSLVNIPTSPYAEDTVLHKAARNVAIDHFIQNQLRFSGQAAIGSLLATITGRNNYIGNVLEFLRGLEKQNVLEPGSTVELDPRYESTGGALFVRVGINYLSAYERFFFTVTV